MRVLPINFKDMEQSIRSDILVAHMAFPEDELERDQIIGVCQREARELTINPNRKKTSVMVAVGRILEGLHEPSRIAGDIALKMFYDVERGRRPSLNYATAFISTFYEMNEKADGKHYPTDHSNLLKTFRKLKSVVHYWAAWQACQDRDGFNFEKNEEDTKTLLRNAELIRLRLSELDYFKDVDFWIAPPEFGEDIVARNLRMEVPEETDPERKFSKDYKHRDWR